MKDYASMSDVDVARMVSAYLWGSVCSLDGVVLHPETSDPFDPCNNPADAWPIIMKSGINVFTDMIPHGLLGQARASITREDAVSECIIFSDKKPLRAAMIVFLMMKESEK